MRTVGQQIFRGGDFPSRLHVIELDFDYTDDEDQQAALWEKAFCQLLIHEAKDAKNDIDSANAEGEASSLICVGLSVWFSDPDCYIEYIVFSTKSRVVIVKAPSEGFLKIPYDARRGFLANFLAGSFTGVNYALVAFELGSIALALHSQCKLPVKAIELSRPLELSPGALPSTVISSVMKKKKAKMAAPAFKETWRRVPPALDDSAEAREARAGEVMARAALRTWMTYVVGNTVVSTMSVAEPVDTHPDAELTTEVLNILAHTQLQFDLLDASKSENTTVDFSTIAVQGTGQVSVKQTTHKNKIRAGDAQDVRLLAEDGTIRFEGQAQRAPGSTVVIESIEDPSVEPLNKKAHGISTIEVIGREDHTGSDAARMAFILNVLQRRQQFLASDFVRMVWIPTEEDIENLSSVSEAQLKTNRNTETERSGATIGGIPLNPSQAEVAKAMLSEHPFALVHGPPGTGKTRTIAAVVKEWAANGKRVYLVAQSNVGVKNIAETLAKQGFLDFKLIVSADFYFEWHEHIYEKCRDQLVSSDQFKEQTVQELFTGAQAILSTVDMLFHPKLKPLHRMYPLERLVVDEASQIFVGSYLAVFDLFRRSLKKVCWFGDPKQLPPHQREQIIGLDSIYDIEHIKNSSMLLDTQYRMPVPIGNFISEVAYDKKLKSWHDIKGLDCLKLIDVPVSAEESNKTSWVNKEEVKVVVQLVKRYYRDLEFCVITPYDAQRKAIELALKAEAMPTKCYNVDSFQGNEADYVIISTVRTSATGFLDLHNRVNVMLTRAKLGMIIVSKKSFIAQAQQTLVGRLADHWSARTRRIKKDGRSGDPYDAEVWVYFRDVMEGRADLPGADGEKEKYMDLKMPDETLPPPIPTGFYPAPRKQQGALPLFNGLAPSAPAKVPRDQRTTKHKGNMAFVQPSSSKTKSSPNPKSPSLGGPPTPVTPWGSEFIRPTVQVGLKPLHGSWAKGNPSASPPVPAPMTRQQSPWASAAKAGGGPKKGKTVAQEVGFTIRIGAPSPNVGRNK